MKNADLSMKIFGIYLAVLGLILAFTPNLVLPIFGFEEVTDIWIRLLGLIFCIISSIYYIAIRDKWLSFYKLSILGRTIVSAFILFWVIFEMAPWPLLIFGIVDLLAALWTAYSLINQKTSIT